MTFDQLKGQVFTLARMDKLAEADQVLLEARDLFTGKALGRWYHLYAQFLRRYRPKDRDAFQEACTNGARLLQGDPEGLCDIYLTQVSAGVLWGQWHYARIHIRRIRAMARRHPSSLGIQKLQGLVLINEGLVERASGNFDRAVVLLAKGIETLQRYLYPADESTRATIVAMGLLDVADSYLRMRQHGKAIEALSRVDPDQVRKQEYGRYCYVQSRYWLALGAATRADEWINRVGESESWDPDWPALVLEVRSQIARAQGETDRAGELLIKALEQTVRSNNHVLASVLRRELTDLRKELNAL